MHQQYLDKNKFQQQIISKKMEALIDYRNARFQGFTNSHSVRNGFGILIDDDLSFYASNWKDGKLNDDTVIYISHGKYIYGQWHENEPHGLNVFRIGDTVVLGEFDNGDLIRKAIIIFEKFNFLAILEQSQEQQWNVCQRGALKSYNDLVKYIEESGIPMQPQYFSLTKFLTHMSNQKAAAVPCPNSQNCYYGFSEGLGIIFNPNNGVVSVGCHQNKKLIEFGGKYQLPTFVVEGNFQTNQIIKYANQRPKMQIYSIFQKIHKRSLNFKNEYFDSKIKLLTHIEELVRAKIDQIVSQNNDKNQQNTFTALDLNDSLDYHAQNLQQINKINKIREDVYQAVHIPLKKATSQYVQASPKSNTKKSIPVTPSKKNAAGLITNAPASPIIMKKSLLKSKPREKQQDKQKHKQKQRQNVQKSRQLHQEHERDFVIQRQRKQIYQHDIKKQKQRLQERHLQIQRTKSRIKQRILQKEKEQQKSNLSRKSSVYLNRHEVQDVKEETFANNYPQPNLLLKQKSSQQIQLPRSIATISQRRIGSNNNEVSPYKPSLYKENLTQMEPPSPIQQILVSSKDYIRQKQLYNVPSFKYSHSQFEKESKTQARFNNIKVQKYEYRQKIENVQWIQSSNGQSGSRQSLSPLSIKQTQLSKSPIKGPNYQNLSERRKRLLKEFKNLNNNSQNPGSILSKIIPAVLEKNNQLSHSQNLNKSSSTIQMTKQRSMLSCQELQSPCAREKIPSYESKNTEQSETFMPLTICRNTNQILGTSARKIDRIEKQQKYSLMYAQEDKKNNYRIQAETSQKYCKENIDASPLRAGPRPFQKKQSYHERLQKQQNSQNRMTKQVEKTNLNGCTPTRKSYKYYFDEL